MRIKRVSHRVGHLTVHKATAARFDDDVMEAGVSYARADAANIILFQCGRFALTRTDASGAPLGADFEILAGMMHLDLPPVEAGRYKLFALSDSEFLCASRFDGLAVQFARRDMAAHAVITLPQGHVFLAGSGVLLIDGAPCEQEMIWAKTRDVAVRVADGVAWGVECW